MCIPPAAGQAFLSDGEDKRMRTNRNVCLYHDVWCHGMDRDTHSVLFGRPHHEKQECSSRQLRAVLSFLMMRTNRNVCPTMIFFDKRKYVTGRSGRGTYFANDLLLLFDLVPIRWLDPHQIVNKEIVPSPVSICASGGVSLSR